MKKFSLRVTFYLFLFSNIVFIPVYAEVSLPALFSDNMVLQQQSEVVLWGWAGAGNNVSIVPSWDEKEYTVKADRSGKWKTWITTPTAGGPYELKISDGTAITIKNVLIGEVWLCSGQSNMEMPMKGFRGQPVIGSNETILRSKNKNIRFISVPRGSTPEIQENFEGRWQEANPETVSEFSATAYYFGSLVQEILDIPVGLVEVSYGGSCIQAWMSRNTATTYEDTPIPETNDIVEVPNRTPTVLFNSMLNPLIGYGIKGCIWYQGETNYQEPDKYTQLFATMVKEWRTLWDIGEFPFYYVQIAPFDYARYKQKGCDVKLNSAYLREAQLKSMNLIPNCGMAVIMDTGEKNCIHPANKKAAGYRLAYWALAQTYGIKGIGYTSPTYKAMEITGSMVILSFDNVESGLTSYGKELTCFEIAGEDKIFYQANAMLRSKSVVLSSPNVKMPVAVRYAFKDYIVGDLFGANGLPVSSFRTDSW